MSRWKSQERKEMTRTANVVAVVIACTLAVMGVLTIWLTGITATLLARLP